MKRLALLPLVAVVSACSEKVPPETAMSKKMYEYKVEQIENQIDDIPSWYTDIPQKEDAVYAVGTSVTPDLQLAVDIATLSAKTTLADRIDSKLRSQLKTFKSKLGANDYDASLMHEFEQATINIIADADVAGYSVKESKIVQHGTQYRAYVLLEYTNGEASKVIRNRLAREEMLLSKLSSTAAWKELNDTVNNINKTKRDETQDVANAIAGLKSTAVPDPEYQ